MKTYIKTALILASICAVAAILLAFVNSVTAPVIEYNAKQVVMEALKDVLCGYSVGDDAKVEGNEYITTSYELVEGSTVKGYVLDLTSKGYGGEMNLLASFDTDGKILAVKMVSNNETPGVGKKSELPGYMDKFIGKGGSESNPVPTSKTMLSSAEAATVGGATLTFNGITRALSAGSDYVVSLGGAK